MYTILMSSCLYFVFEDFDNILYHKLLVLNAMGLAQMGRGHFFTSHFGNNLASVTWATKVSTKWVDQIDHLTDIFKGVTTTTTTTKRLN